MKAVQKFFALGAVLAASSSLAFATPVTSTAATIGVSEARGGSTNIGNGKISFNPGTAGYDGVLTSATGMLSTDMGDFVNLNTLTFNATGSTNNLNEVLVASLKSAAQQFTFTVNSVQVLADTANDILVLQGIGTFAGTGIPTSTGVFQLTSTEDGAGGATSTSLDITAAASVTPEPNSLILMGTGLIGAAGLMFMRRRTANGLL